VEAQMTPNTKKQFWAEKATLKVLIPDFNLWYGTGTKTGTYINGIEQKIQKQAHTSTAIWFLTKLRKDSLSNK
jgi:hypothetical protein